MKHAWIIAALLLASPAFAGDTSKIGGFSLSAAAPAPASLQPPLYQIDARRPASDFVRLIAGAGASICGPISISWGGDFDVLRLAAGECLPASKTPVTGEKK